MLGVQVLHLSAATATVAPNGQIALSVQVGGPGQMYDIGLVNPDGTGLHALPVNATENEFSPDWSPDGSSVAFMTGSFGGSSFRIQTAKVDGSDLRTLTGTGALQPKWSPDGKLIAYKVLYSDTGTQGQLWVVNADGTNARALPYPFNYVEDYDWLADGTIAFISFDLRGEGSHSIYRSPLTGTPQGGTTQLVFDGTRMDTYKLNSYGTGLTGSSNMEYSPDGSQVLLTIDRGLTQVCTSNENVIVTDLFTYTPATDAIAQVTHTTGGLESQESDAAWSPDGTRIVFNALHPSCREGTTLQLSTTVDTARTDGTDVQQVTATSAGGPAWQPCTAAAGSCTASVVSTSPSASASPVPTGSASSSPSSSSSPTSGSSPTSSPSGSPGCPVVQIATSTPVINATGLASVTVTGAAPGAPVEVQGYSQNHYGTATFDNDPTKVDRSGDADQNGTITFNDLRPASNTRLRARQQGCDYGGTTVITVRAQETLAVGRSGTRAYVFSGNSIPARPGGLIITLYRIVGTPCAAGVAPSACPGEVALGQGRADQSTGQYRIPVQFAASNQGVRASFVVKTGADAQNAPGRSNARSLLIT